MKIASILFSVCTVLLVAGLFFCGAFFFIIHNHVIDFSALSRYKTHQPSLLLDDECNEWARFQLDKRDPVEGVGMSQNLINAFIAAEDWHFFSHHGISGKGIIRSFFANLYHGRKAQGASTITQQLVKLLFLDFQKTFSRKIKEQLYAVLVEQQFTKEQILHTYLNHVCFGCGIYGVEAATQRFWSKHAHEITIDECATLAGIICAPARYCPLTYPLSAENRRNIILGKMRYLRFITEQEYTEAIATKVKVRDKVSDLYAPHVKEMIRMHLENVVGKEKLYSGGLSIKTTLNKKMQDAAEKAFKTNITKLKHEFHEDIDGGMIVIDRKTGEIKALVGGFDFAASQWNRVTQAIRQIGSVIKPLIYANAVLHGTDCTTTEIDEPFKLVSGNTVWAPKNYNKRFNGEVTLAYALSHSNNIVSIKTFLKNDPRDIVNLAQRCRLKGSFHTYPSLALGCVDGTLLEVMGMFNIFPNDGVYVEPHCIISVTDRCGERLYKVKPEKERILASSVVGHIASILCLGPERVKKMYGKHNWIQSEAMSKTGTTNDSRTCWFVGSTPTLTTAVYVGFDDNRSMGEDVYPIKTAFPIWLAFNKEVDGVAQKFSYDAALHKVTINERTGKICQDNSPGAITIMV